MTGKSNATEVEWARAPPPAKPWPTRIGHCFYNPDDKSILGRTTKRWGIVFIFYAVFYLVLAILIALCFVGLNANLDPEVPYFLLEDSLILHGGNPGVAHRPYPEDGATVAYQADNYTYYSKEMAKFAKDYENETWFSSKPGCNAADHYGFPHIPCFFIKLNRVYNWKPDFYAKGELPSDAPADLLEAAGTEDHVWISCEPEKGSEDTKIEYPWGRGLPGHFYPYTNQVGYKSPIVAVQITPQSNKKVAVRCRAWAKNIVYKKSLKEPSGYTRIVIEMKNATLTAKE